MHLRAYRTFDKVARRIQLLYEVTIHSYGVMYEAGRQKLRDKKALGESIDIELESRTVKRPLKILAFHSRDVYPHMLRANLLVRLVTAFEVFLVDAVEEVAERSDTPFEIDARVEMSQRQFLALGKQQLVKDYVVRRTTRQMTSGGLDEIRKFYTKCLGVDVHPPTLTLTELQEIHERRHIHVHRAGYADEQYVHKYPATGAKIDQVLPVAETYLLRAIEVLSQSAEHVHQAVTAKYPAPPIWTYLDGSQSIAATVDQLMVVSATVANFQSAASLLNLTAPLKGTHTITSVVVWVGTRGGEVRWLVGGSTEEMTLFFRLLSAREHGGDISNVDYFKVKRDGA
ncbi:MAG: hypothetical protein KF740_08565 [Ramlibacter sp.]|nr:hypothetical protein [Ramlibacter sp.]